MADPKDVDLRLVVGEPEGDQPINRHCPAHIHVNRVGQRDQQGSLRVYEKNLHCYGCQWHTSRRDLWGSLAFLLGLWDGLGQRCPYALAMQAKARSDKYTSAHHLPRSRANMASPVSQSAWVAYEKFLWTARRHRATDYLIGERGYTEEALHVFHIGHDGARFVIPVFDWSHNVLTYRYRRDDYYNDEAPKYDGTYGHNQPVLYPMWLLAEQATSDLVVVEGEFDCLPLWQRGYSAVTITNGAGQGVHIPSHLREQWGGWGSLETLVVATDVDAVGLAQRPTMIEAIKAEGKGAEDVRWPVEWGKDMTAALKGHSYEEITRSLREGTGGTEGRRHSL